MLWTLVYLILTQNGSGTLQTDIWATELQFGSQQQCLEAADKAAPKLMAAGSTYVGPSGGISGPNPNAITVQPACFPAAK